MEILKKDTVKLNMMKRKCFFTHAMGSVLLMKKRQYAPSNFATVCWLDCHVIGDHSGTKWSVLIVTRFLS